MTDELKPVRCGCGGEAEVIKHEFHGASPSYGVECTNCHAESWPYYDTEAEAVTAWNRAMGGNVQDCAKDARCNERIAKAEEDEWTEHKMLSRDYGKIYYQHDCSCNLYESPYPFCPNCGMKMKRGDR